MHHFHHTCHGIMRRDLLILQTNEAQTKQETKAGGGIQQQTCLGLADRCKNSQSDALAPYPGYPRDRANHLVRQGLIKGGYSYPLSAIAAWHLDLTSRLASQYTSIVSTPPSARQQSCSNGRPDSAFLRFLHRYALCISSLRSALTKSIHYTANCSCHAGTRCQFPCRMLLRHQRLRLSAACPSHL